MDEFRRRKKALKVLQERVPITATDNYGTLYARLAERGATLLVQSLEMLRQGEAIKQPQNQAAVTWAPAVSKEMRRIHWELSAPEVAGWIRGLDPRPGAYALWKGRVLKLFGARVKKSDRSLASPGTVLKLTPQGLEIACGQGSVAVQALQLAGHKRLEAADFLRGQPLIKQVLD